MFLIDFCLLLFPFTCDAFLWFYGLLLASSNQKPECKVDDHIVECGRNWSHAELWELHTRTHTHTINVLMYTSWNFHRIFRILFEWTEPLNLMFKWVLGNSVGITETFTLPESHCPKASWSFFGYLTDSKMWLLVRIFKNIYYGLFSVWTM